jgi:hypothetical protein
VGYAIRELANNGAKDRIVLYAVDNLARCAILLIALKADILVLYRGDLIALKAYTGDAEEV